MLKGSQQQSCWHVSSSTQ